MVLLYNHSIGLFTKSVETYFLHVHPIRIMFDIQTKMDADGKVRNAVSRVLGFQTCVGYVRSFDYIEVIEQVVVL